MTQESLVGVERRDSIAIVRLDRPDSLNAMNLELLDQLRNTLLKLEDEDVRGIVLVGNGPATCAGMDVDLVSDKNYAEKYKEDVDRMLDDIFSFLTSFPYPTVVGAHGALVGVGVGISLRCDFLVLGQETTFSLPEIQYGISTASVMPFLEHIVGYRTAREVVMTGEAIDPERAYDLGLANNVVEEDAVDETAVELAEQIAEYDAGVVRELKEASANLGQS